MLNNKQSEAIAEALLSPAREVQEAARRHKEKNSLSSHLKSALLRLVWLA